MRLSSVVGEKIPIALTTAESAGQLAVGRQPSFTGIMEGLSLCELKAVGMIV
jgi:hypothetical protein